jgi:hypothetical protein
MKIFSLSAINDINLNFIISPSFSIDSLNCDSNLTSLDYLITKSVQDTLCSTNYNFVAGKFFQSIPDSISCDSLLIQKINSLKFISYITPTDFHFKSNFSSPKLFASNLRDTTKYNYPKNIVTIKADSFQVDIISLYSPDFTITADLDSTIIFDYYQKRIIKNLFSKISKNSNMIIVITSYPKFVCKRIFPKDKRLRYIINFDEKVFRDFKLRKRIFIKSFRFKNGIGQIHLNYKNKQLNSSWKFIKLERAN